MHLVRVDRLGIPKESRGAFGLLEGAGISAGDLANPLRAMVGFRDVAVHDDLRPDLAVVESIFDRHLDDLLGFAAMALRGSIRGSTDGEKTRQRANDDEPSWADVEALFDALHATRRASRYLQADARFGGHHYCAWQMVTSRCETSTESTIRRTPNSRPSLERKVRSWREASGPSSSNAP
jgi:hypothetical protein